MVEFTHTTGPRILEDGTNLDADFQGGHPVIIKRSWLTIRSVMQDQTEKITEPS